MIMIFLMTIPIDGSGYDDMYAGLQDDNDDHGGDDDDMYAGGHLIHCCVTARRRSECTP